MAEDLLTRSGGVVRRDVAGETFLVPVRGSIADLQELFIANEVGGWLWDRLEHPSRLDEVVADLVAEFEVDEQQAREDVNAFLQQLSEAGLLETVPSAEG